ncbi:MAG TPA: phosphatidate cytidylyltransferase, partial [Flavisolibacter sp.]|nr:phosphatidate cytidylyltransferase [Flavisolibacter sp.]
MEPTLSIKQPVVDTTRKRVLTGIVLIGVITVCIYAGAPGFLVLVLFLNEMGLLEYQRLVRRAGFPLQPITAPLISLMALFAIWFTAVQHLSYSPLFFFLLVPFLVLIMEIFRKSETPFQNAALCVLGLAWISLSLALFLLTGFLPWKNGDYQPQLIMGYFLLLWSSDSGAYLVGKTIGKHKLLPRVSPHKTWEGSFGGLLAACITAFINHFLFASISLAQWQFIAVVVVITGTLGDLAKSKLKRSVGVKDAGTLLPGHGGILDRFDSL